MKFESKNLTPEQLQAAQAAYDAGGTTYGAVAKAAGISHKAAKALFDRAGVVSTAAPAPLTQEQKDAARLRERAASCRRAAIDIPVRAHLYIEKAEYLEKEARFLDGTATLGDMDHSEETRYRLYGTYPQWYKGPREPRPTLEKPPAALPEAEEDDDEDIEVWAARERAKAIARLGPPPEAARDED